LQQSLKVISIGDLVVDIIAGISQFPIRASEHQLARKITLEPGGAGNFLIAGAHLGLNMAALGVVGDDLFGAAMLDILSDKDIDVKGVIQQKDGTTTTVLVLSDLSGRHVFLGEYGVGSEISISEHWRESLGTANAVQTWGYTFQESRLSNAMLDSMAYARQEGCRVYFDPGPYSGDALPEQIQTALKNSDVVLLTEEEIPHLIEDSRDVESARKILDYGPILVCVKRGPEGCIIFTEEEALEHPGFPVQVRDTSAAGDSFNAAFLYAHLNGWSLRQIAAFANAMGAAKVRKFGTGRQVPTSNEVRLVLEEFGEDLPF
jgi:ribokinase